MDADHEPLFVDGSFRKYVARDIGCKTDPVWDWRERIEVPLLDDDAPAFIELMNNLPSDIDPLEAESGLDEIWSNMSKWDSAKCALAVVDGQFDKYLTDSWLESLGHNYNAPLHHFVANAAFNTTALLLQTGGFSADVRCKFYDHTFTRKPLGDVLPINVILAALRYRIMFWSKAEPTAIPLVFYLCSMKFRGLLETLRVIAPKTSEIKHEFFNYLNQGKMIEVGALLMVAKSSILSSSTAKGEGEFQSNSEIRDFVLNTNNDKSAEMEEMLVLLDILNKSGDKLATLLRLDFTQTPFEFYCSMRLAASLTEDAGYDGTKHFNDLFFTSKRISESRKCDMDECDVTMLTSDKWPSWVTEAAWRGFGDDFGSTCRLTYQPFSAGTRTQPPYMIRVPVPPFTAPPPIYEYPIPANLMGVHHVLN